eukprot:1182184-Prorocentrum_minimum.AAC.3
MFYYLPSSHASVSPGFRAPKELHPYLDHHVPVLLRGMDFTSSNAGRFFFNVFVHVCVCRMNTYTRERPNSLPVDGKTLLEPRSSKRIAAWGEVTECTADHSPPFFVQLLIFKFSERATVLRTLKVCSLWWDNEMLTLTGGRCQASLSIVFLDRASWDSSVFKGPTTFKFSLHALDGDDGVSSIVCNP